ncbi:MAG: DUF3307 domain-containing protein [Anaerolineaceae bacterium]|nr:DUF3307 domain-containing protein [Anaerolineaceae bacterium]
MTNGMLFLVLLSAHLVGDFYFQSAALAGKKEKEYSRVLLHSLIYAVFVFFVFLVIETPLLVLVAAAAAHWIIDSFKWLLRNQGWSKSMWFVVDQLLHLVSLFVITSLTPAVEIRPWLAGLPEDFWPWLTLILLIVKPVNISIDILFKRYAEAAKRQAEKVVPTQKEPLLAKEELSSAVQEEGGLTAQEVEGAGASVGTFERIFAVIFAALGQYAALGLLMAAKSMARYDRINKSPAFAEYYLIGTLYSILFAIVAYLFVFEVILSGAATVDPLPVLILTPTPLP